MRLPNGHRASLGSKLDDYVLNASHREGKHKARRFKSKLGITLGNADLLRRALLDAAACSDTAIWKGDNGFGDVYAIRFHVETETGAGTVLSAWIIRHGEDFPRLTSCYVV